MAIELIQEATDAGAREFKACEILGVSTRTLRRNRPNQPVFSLNSRHTHGKVHFLKF